VTPKQLERAGKALFGPLWQSALARALYVDSRTVRRWLAGDREIPGPAVAAIECLLANPPSPDTSDASKGG
jgi:DNA-binding transcriptional regulator YiaG